MSSPKIGRVVLRTATLFLVELLEEPIRYKIGVGLDLFVAADLIVIAGPVHRNDPTKIKIGAESILYPLPHQNVMKMANFSAEEVFQAKSTPFAVLIG